MSDVLGSFADGLGEIIASPSIQLALRAIAIYLVAIWLATAFVVWRDLGRRFTSSIPAYLGAAVIVLATPILFPAAWLVIRMVRPEQTVDERESQAMELALLARDALERCPECRRSVRDEWLVCPSCGSRLARRCVKCEGLLKPDWDLCPWCAADLSPGILPESVDPAVDPAAPVVAPVSLVPGPAQPTLVTASAPEPLVTASAPEPLVTASAPEPLAARRRTGIDRRSSKSAAS
jgi:RNA polymerase subunit RPABC4/transcription elongation factor Spt4